MLVLAHPSSDNDLPPEPRRRTRGAIVWRAHTEGFATIAYRDGRAIAGISGPWSQQYVLIWWQPSQPIREVEVFDSLDAAKQAVALGSGPIANSHLDALLATLRHEYIVPKPTWLRRLVRWLSGTSRQEAAATGTGSHPVARRAADEITDWRGLNFRAIR